MSEGRLVDNLLNRRDVLRVGALSLTSHIVPSSPSRAASAGSASAQSVIFLWMSGGVTHLDSFDPKPLAPQEIRGTLGAISTSIPGIQFSETLPQLARCADQLAVVRTFCHDSNDHFIGQAHCLSGRRVTAQQTFSEPNIGSIASREFGPRHGFPGYLAVPGTTRAGAEMPFTAGWLGREYDPFCTGGLVPLKLAEEDANFQGLKYADGLTAARLTARQTLSEQLEDAARRLDRRDRAEVLSRQYGAAFELMLSPAVRRAFDLRQEADGMRDDYGRTKIGQRCLLARRLVEAGAGFVMVDYGVDVDSGNTWDNHNAPGQNHPPICEIVKEPYHLAGADRAFAALLADLRQRGLLEQTLVVFLTEFGRTPRINKEGGRDHWCYAGSIFFAGGGTQGGQVIGKTDDYGGYSVGESYSPGDVAATIYDSLGMDWSTMLHDPQSRPIPLLPEGAPIPGILG